MWKFRLFQEMKIKKQLIVVYIAAVFLPIILVGGFLLGNTYKLLENYYRDLLESENLRAKTVLFEITTQIYNISEEIALDKNLRELLVSRPASPNAQAQAISRVSMVDDYEYSYAEIDKIEIYTDNWAFYDYKQFRRVDESIEKESWYQKAVSQTSVFWYSMNTRDQYGNEYWNLCLIRKIPLSRTGENAVLVISLSDNYLRTRVDSREYSTALSVDDGPVISGASRNEYGKPQRVEIDYEQLYFEYQGNVRIDKKTCFADVSTLSLYQSDSRLYICTVNDQAVNSVWSVIWLSFVIIVVAICLPAVILFWFTSVFTDRILALRKAMHQASNEDYDLEMNVVGQDEVSEAFVDLKVMIRNIKQKDADMYEAKLNEKELINRQQAIEFRMLSNQINPHFLYNALETIRMKAFRAGDREVASAIKLLGKSMRYTLENTGTAYTTLAREVDQVNTYLAIQKLRFEEKFESSTEISADLNAERVHVLPLLLQPVVENAILHGMEEMERGGLIRIEIFSEQEACERELLCIRVSDNGCGMPEPVLTELRERIGIKDMSRSRSIGLSNVNQRIKLCYGERYGVEVFSTHGKGTLVCMTFPLERLDEPKN